MFPYDHSNVLLVLQTQSSCSLRTHCCCKRYSSGIIAFYYLKTIFHYFCTVVLGGQCSKMVVEKYDENQHNTLFYNQQKQGLQRKEGSGSHKQKPQVSCNPQAILYSNIFSHLHGKKFRTQRKNGLSINFSIPVRLFVMTNYLPS